MVHKQNRQVTLLSIPLHPGLLRSHNQALLVIKQNGFGNKVKLQTLITISENTVVGIEFCVENKNILSIPSNKLYNSHPKYISPLFAADGEPVLAYSDAPPIKAPLALKRLLNTLLTGVVLIITQTVIFFINNNSNTHQNGFRDSP
jgi:hypothetical protein